MTKQLNIIFCLEKGVLEEQALLLVHSAIRWLKDFDLAFHAYSPRADHWPGEGTVEQLLDLGVSWCNEELNIHFNHYPIANKVLACKHFEQTHSQQTSAMFLDTDTVFVNTIEDQLMANGQQLYLRPVDNKGPGSESELDPNDKFWQDTFKLCDVELPKFHTITTVGSISIRNYFNAGLIWAHQLSGFFEQWYTDFVTLIDSDLRPFGYQSRDGDDFRCLDQVALAVTASRYAEHLQVLPEWYNYPLPFRPIMQQRKLHPYFEKLVHIHYHKWFQHPEFLDHVTTEDEKNSVQYLWLKQYLPLEPLIDSEFKC